MGGDQGAGAGGKGIAEGGIPFGRRSAVPVSHLGDGTAEAGRQGGVGLGMEDVRVKLLEELEELFQADSPEKREEELGDLLFFAVALAHFLGGSEQALLEACRKFDRRFRFVEQRGGGRRARDWSRFPWRSWTNGGTRPKPGDCEKSSRVIRRFFPLEAGFSLFPRTISLDHRSRR